MKKEEIKKYLDTDIEFNVNGRGACFLSSICVVGYDYEGQGELCGTKWLEQL